MTSYPYSSNYHDVWLVDSINYVMFVQVIKDGWAFSVRNVLENILVTGSKYDAATAPELLIHDAIKAAFQTIQDKSVILCFVDDKFNPSFINDLKNVVRRGAPLGDRRFATLDITESHKTVIYEGRDCYTYSVAENAVDNKRDFLLQ